MDSSKCARLLVRAMVAAALFVALFAPHACHAGAGDIFTRTKTKMSYPATRRIAVKTEHLDDDIRYFSSDRDVAMVGKDGEIMTVGAGECTIFAKGSDGEWDTCHLTVEEKGTAHKQIALTFDDGPDFYGQELLDFLADRDVHVTFFYIGNQVAKYADNVLRAYNEGHEIGNHSYTHAVLGINNVDKIKSELSQCDEAIKAVLGVYPTVFRPPYGSKTDTLLQNCGYPAILWSVDTLDWQYKNADRVCEQVYKGASDGAVILVHEIHKTTIAGVKTAIDKLLADGWEFVTITELMERDGQKMEDGKVYSRKKNE